jgi:hypothetical protein
LLRLTAYIKIIPMKISETQFIMLSTDQRISAIEISGTYLMHRKTEDFMMLLYELSGYYAEVWQTNDGDIKAVEMLHDDEVISLYLDSLQIELI